MLDPAGDRYDAVILIEFDPEDRVAGAWKLTAAELVATATSLTTENGKRILKVPVGGDWTRRAIRIEIAGGKSGLQAG